MMNSYIVIDILVVHNMTFISSIKVSTFYININESFGANF